MNTAFQLILLPGLGADRRLLEPQRREFPQLVVPPWIPPRTDESLPDYAARMAETVKPLLEKSPRPLGEGPGVRACPGQRGHVGRSRKAPSSASIFSILGWNVLTFVRGCG